MKNFTKAIALCMALLMILTCPIGASAAEVADATIDFEQKGSLTIYKIDLTNAEKDGIARLAGKNDSRITKVGRFIRACRIDELPQLFNILMGDMSIVGPRPERPEIAEQYIKTLPEFSRRTRIKAGLTGYAQVYGKYNTSAYDKLRLDMMYIENYSLLLDIKLIILTLRIIFSKGGLSRSGYACL